MAIKIYVGNLPGTTSPEIIKDLFLPFGGIQKISVATDILTNRHLGFGFVTFEQKKSAKKALRLHGTMVDGQIIQVNFARLNERAGSGGRRDPRRNHVFKEKVVSF